jgi:transcriptional regulator with XRE-family HTH domain
MESKNHKLFTNVDFLEDLTGEIPKLSDTETVDIGKKIRDIRNEKQRTLEEVANRTGFDVQLLSRIEKAEVQPTLGVIIKLSKALDSAFGNLVSGTGDKPYSITRRHENKAVTASTSSIGERRTYTRKSLAPEVKGRHMEPLIVELENISVQEPQIHEGEESIYVLDGVVCLKIGNDDFELNPGDNAYYPSAIPHIIGAKGERATILAVMYAG